MSGIPVLSIITFLPVLGAAAVMLIRDSESAQRRMRIIALGFTVVDFVLSLLLWANFNTGTSDFQFVERADWLGAGIGYKMGVDGISVLFVVLTALAIMVPPHVSHGRKTLPSSSVLPAWQELH